MMKIAISPSSFGSSPKPIELLKEQGFEIIDNPFKRRLTEEEIKNHLIGIDGLIAGLEPLNRNVLLSAPQLKVIARVGIGIANVDLEAAKELGIKVSNTPEGPTEAVAEMCLTALLSLSRELIWMNNSLHADKWDKKIGSGIRGVNVLLIGYGRIGKKFGEMLRNLGANISIFDPGVQSNQLQNGESLVLNLEQGLANADVISFHANGENEIIGVKEFKSIKKGVILLNSARGSLINEEGLIDALDNETVSSAWMDAFWKEPYTGKLTKYPQVLLTPHAATYTKQCRESMEVAAVMNLIRDLDLS